MSNVSFKEHVRDAAERFLRTAVLIDDDAFMDSGQDQPGSLDAPAPSDTAASSRSASAARPRPSGAVDAKAVVDAFADGGLICGVLKPTGDDADPGMRERLVQTAGRADIIVLDWILNADDGAAALNLIAALVDSDQRTAYGRLRLIAIYTREASHASIADAIKTRLGSRVGRCSEADSTDVWIECGGLRLIIVAKEGTNVPGARSVDIVDLPRFLVEHFARMTYGIVPTLALQCLAILRENAHHLLRRFHAGLDGPLLSHRALADPDDAEDFAVSLMGLELKSLLDAADVRRYVDVEVSKLWAEEYLQKDEYRLAADVVLTRAEAVGLLGSGAVPDKISNTRLKKFKSITPALHDSDEAADRADHEFARLSSLSREHPDHYRSTRPPVLTLGTLLRTGAREADVEGPGWMYFLCVQPACDAVRLKRATKFALLSVGEANGEKQFDVVALGPESKLLRLITSVKVSDLSVAEFVPDADERVRAREREDEFVFTDETETEYYWLGQLRDHHAIRIATRLSAVLGRPGVDEYEWLRRHGRGD